MNIAQLLTPKVCTTFLHDTNTVRQGLETLLRHGYTALPVLDEEENYLGSVSEGDILQYMMARGTTSLKKMERALIMEIYRADRYKPLNIRATEQEITGAMMQQNFVPIVDDRGCFCGIVTRSTFMEVLAQECGYSSADGSEALAPEMKVPVLC